MTAPWAGAFRDLPREHGFERLRVEGTIPAALCGTLYRCGPALMSSFGRPYRHLFDGDGAVTAVRLDDRGAHGAVRIVETPGLVAERQAGRALHPAYGTLPPGPAQPLPRPKHAANISMLSLGERLFALHEAGAPIEIDAAELRTLGEHDLGAPTIRAGFSAHPHAVPARRAHYNFGVHYERTTTLELYELHDGAARTLGVVELAGPTMIHDFAVTERHLIFFAPPLRLDVKAFASGLTPYSDALAWRPEHGTEIIIVPIDEPARVVRFTVEPFYQWHFANAFERAGEIVVDFVRYPDFTSNRWIGSLVHGQAWPEVRQGGLVRATIDLTTRAYRMDAFADRSIEFPAVSPMVVAQPHRFVYTTSHAGTAASHGLYDRLVRVDVETGALVEVELGAAQYPSEPVFVPRGTADDDGWLLTLVYDATSDTSHIAILDASQLQTGPVARIWFDHHIPFTLHGIWQPAERVQ